MKPHKLDLGIIIALSILLGIMCLVFLPRFPVTSDSLDYENIALHIIEKAEYSTISSDQIIYPPLYPIFLAVFYPFTAQPHETIFLLQFLLVGAIACVAYLFVKRFLKLERIPALILALLVLVWPYFTLYSLLISSEVVFTIFLLSSIYFFFAFIENPTKKNAIITAILIGLAVLARPVALLLPFWVFGLILVAHYAKFITLTREHFKKGLLILAFFIITLIPWTLYVYVKFDRVIPVASNLSYVFNKANKSLEYLGEEKLTQEKKTAGDVVKAKLTNIYLFWNPGASGYHVDGLVAKHSSAQWGVQLYKVGFFLILALALFSIKWIREKKEILFLCCIILYFWSLHTVLFPFPRYTLPIIPLVIILAVYSGNYLLRSWLKKS